MDKTDLRQAIEILLDIALPTVDSYGFCKTCPAKAKCIQTHDCVLCQLISFVHDYAITINEEEKLEPCPFCGHKKIVYSSKDYGDTYSIWIECAGCGCRTQSKTVSTAEMISWQLNEPMGIKVAEARSALQDKWNRRKG